MKKKKIILIMLLLIILFNVITPCSSKAVVFWDKWNDDPIYKEPNIIGGSSSDGLDGVINDAEEFENQEGQIIGQNGGTGFKLKQEKLQDFSSSLYGILLIAATAVSVLVGIVLGIKYMIGSVEQKAEYKKLLLPYVIGCVAVYGSLFVWKLVVNLLGSI